MHTGVYNGEGGCEKKKRKTGHDGRIGWERSCDKGKLDEAQKKWGKRNRTKRIE